MSLKKTKANQLSRDDIVRVLDMEEENLSADICSKLKHNRYKAIDHAGIIDKRDHVREAMGWAIATAASVAVVVFVLNNKAVINEKTSVVAVNQNKDSATFAAENPETKDGDEERLSNKLNRELEHSSSGTTAPNITDENNQKEEMEDLEIYEWLYNNYG